MPVQCYSVFVSAIMLAVWGTQLHPPRVQDQSARSSNTVATIDGVAITDEQLKTAAAKDLDRLEMEKLQFEANLDRKRFGILQNALARLVEERLINAESAKRGISKEDLLASEVEKKLQEPSAEQVNAFYEANKARMPQPKEQVLPQIREYLKQQAYNKFKGEYIEGLKKHYGVTYSLEPPRISMESAGHPARGPENALVTLVEFSDFQCSFCKTFSSTLERVLKTNEAEVRLVFRQLPLSEIHPQAEKAAQASLCANDQGRFWEMHDLMFQEQGSLQEEALKAKAAKLGLDTAAFNKCLDSGRYANRVKEDVLAGTRAGVSGTPALFINGRFLSGARPYEELIQTINEEIQRKKATVPSRP